MSTKASYESAAWAPIRGEWKPLYGSFSREGVSMEWHDFDCDHALNWSRSFHPKSLEICLNLTGCGSVGNGKSRLVFNPRTSGHYVSRDTAPAADRHAGQRHRFLTVEISPDWLQNQAGVAEKDLNPGARAFLNGRRSPDPSAIPLSESLVSLIEQVRRPALNGGALNLWYHAKVLEVVAETLFERPKPELFCARQKRLAEERVDRVKAILTQRLEEPPPLADLGREIGCSPFYLCRTFSQHTGVTISQYLRKIRMEKAAQMLQSGDYNVTETAMAVGYSSLSHFSKVFAETYHTCPCVYPVLKRSPQAG